MTQPAYREILARLVAFPTVSSASNLELVAYADDLLTRHGFSTQRHTNEGGEKANLFAQIGPTCEGGVMLSGHTDVVPVAGANWTSDPFVLLERDGRLYGRGTSDMKGFIALVLALCGAIDARRLRAPLFVALTYDEEVGCWGARQLVDTLVALPHRPRFAWIGEPTDGDIVAAHKGLQVYHTSVAGKSAHSSRPDLGESAITHAAQLIRRISDVLSTTRDEAFNPPRSTFNVGTITGGSAINVIAEVCQFGWEVRPVPGDDSSLILPRWEEIVRAESAAKAIRVDTRLVTEVPSMSSGENDEAVRCLQHLSEQHTTTTAPFVTEGGIYQRAGIPTVIFGPGSLEDAHQVDEGISIGALNRHYEILENLLLKELYA